MEEQAATTPVEETPQAVVTIGRKPMQTIEMVVTRADGTVEDLGMVSFKHPNPFVTFGWYLRHPEQWWHKTKKFGRFLAANFKPSS